MSKVLDSDQLENKRARQRGGRRNVYISHEDEMRLHRLGVGERDLSPTIHRALVLLEQQQADYIQRISQAIYDLGVFASTGKGEKDHAIWELERLLDNELAAKAIALAIMKLCVEAEFRPREADLPQDKE
jgi:hypothetical protein